MAVKRGCTRSLLSPWITHKEVCTNWSPSGCCPPWTGIKSSWLAWSRLQYPKEQCLPTYLASQETTVPPWGIVRPQVLHEAVQLCFFLKQNGTLDLQIHYRTFKWYYTSNVSIYCWIVFLKRCTLLIYFHEKENSASKLVLFYILSYTQSESELLCKVVCITNSKDCVKVTVCKYLHFKNHFN